MPRSLLLLVMLLPLLAHAHKPSDSYLTLDLRQSQANLRWDIALRDLDLAIGLDQDGDRQLTWAEIQSAHPAVAAHATQHIRLLGESGECRLSVGKQRLAIYSDGNYSVLPLHSECPSNRLRELEYSLLFKLDPTHRGLLQVISDQGVSTHVLSPNENSVSLDTGSQAGWLETFAQFVRKGMWHIWVGLDHVLFLLTLMLPLACRTHRYTCGPTDVVWILTAFTAAHSITLSLASLGLISLPSRWVESAIAATVLLTALNNLRPFLPGPLWAVAFVLGLIHGFGFATVLADLGLPLTATLVALGGFNLGVELGQIALVAALAPVVFVFRDTRAFQLPGMRLASLAIALLASLWLIERGFNLEVMPL